jgi:hypothetical protein
MNLAKTTISLVVVGVLLIATNTLTYVLASNAADECPQQAKRSWFNSEIPEFKPGKRW